VRGRKPPQPALQLPPTLQGVLAARIDCLPAEPKTLLQVAAVIGKAGTHDLLQRVVDLPDTALLQQLSHLQRAEFLYEQPASPEPNYTFKHILIQEVAYALLPQAWKQTVHERAAEAIEALAGERVAEHHSELAHHYSRSGNIQQAVVYLQRAGQQAADRSAYQEAITHLTRGLELLPHLPDAHERIQHELDLHITLGQALIVIKGQAAPEAEQAFTRARGLCQQLGETPQLFEALAGLRMIHEARGELPQARELAEQLLSLAQRQSHPARLMRAYNVLGATSLYLGAFAPARAYLEQGIALAPLPRDCSAALPRSDHIQGGSVLGVSCRRHVALTLWYLGYPEYARQRSDEAIVLAQELVHPHSLAYALYFATQLHCLRREAPAAQAQAEALLELARQQEIPAREVRGTVLRGWALAAQGQSTEGIARMRQGMDAHRSMGAMQRPYDLALLAQAYAWIGQTTEARHLLAEALALTHRYGGYYYQAEVHRLTGEVLLMQDAGGGVPGSPAPELPKITAHKDEATGPSPRPTEAEACFRQALDIARQQQAKSLELRAAMSLSRLWQQQGWRTEAYQLLAPLYDWFTEGFDTADLQDAKALLDALA
jgi:tetratricopeptide (TPR) repeat protein